MIPLTNHDSSEVAVRSLWFTNLYIYTIYHLIYSNVYIYIHYIYIHYLDIMHDHPVRRQINNVTWTFHQRYVVTQTFCGSMNPIVWSQVASPPPNMPPCGRPHGSPAKLQWRASVVALISHLQRWSGIWPIYAFTMEKCCFHQKKIWQFTKEKSGLEQGKSGFEHQTCGLNQQQYKVLLFVRTFG